MPSDPKRAKTEEIPLEHFMPPKPMSTKRILLVDDDKFLLEFFGRILAAQGFITVLAGNGSEAEQILESDTKGFDLMVVDLLMPVQSGWKLVEHVRATEGNADIPIIALTGLSLSYEEFERIRDQTNAVLLKGDFEISRFTDTINELLREAEKKRS